MTGTVPHISPERLGGGSALTHQAIFSNIQVYALPADARSTAPSGTPSPSA